MTTLTILRKQRGLTQTELAKELGISRQELSKLESGWQVRVRKSAEEKLTEFFGSQWTLQRLLAEPKVRWRSCPKDAAAVWPADYRELERSS